MQDLIKWGLPFLKGIATMVLPENIYVRNAGAAPSARYSYAVFMRHLVYIRDAGATQVPKSLVELGPGNTIGVGLAGLLAGVESYTGLDAFPFCRWNDCLTVFDDLVELFRNRTPIPNQGEFKNIKPCLNDHSFPHDLLPEDKIEKLLAPERLQKIRRQIRGEGGESIRYVAPWSGSEIVRTASQHWVISQAVMQHVTDPDDVHGAIARWLLDGGYVSHQINFGSHGITSSWNGHWAYSGLAWKLIKGKRPFLLNRRPCSAHIHSIENKKLNILTAKKDIRDGGILKEQVSRDCLLSESDLSTGHLFVVAQKLSS